jgi:hypothetical protein
MQRRRKMLSDLIPEQDPGKDLFAVLFLAFFLLLTINLAVRNFELNLDKQPTATPSVDLSDRQYAEIGKSEIGVYFRVGKQVFTTAEFIRELPSLGIIIFLDKKEAIQISANTQLNAVEWETAKRTLISHGYSVISLIPE